MSKGGRIINQEWVSPTFNQTADGVFWLSLTDFLAWERAVRSRALLKPESWSQIFTPVVLNSGEKYPYGFAWEITEKDGQTVHEHDGGTALAGLCYCLTGISSGFTVLVLALLMGGIGAATQHPIASALVTRTFSGAIVADVRDLQFRGRR